MHMDSYSSATKARSSKYNAYSRQHTIIYILGRLAVSSALLLGATHVAADEDYWFVDALPNQVFYSGPAACDGLTALFTGWRFVWQPLYFLPGDYRVGQFAGGICLEYRIMDGAQFGFIGVHRTWTNCSLGKNLNPQSGECESPTAIQQRKTKGILELHSSDNNPSSCRGNPINIASGNKFQFEIDYALKNSSLTFSRFYNSSDGLWRGKFSSSAVITPDSILITLDDGYQALFKNSNGVASPTPGDIGTLQKTGENWAYRSKQNEQMTFDSSGRLISIEQSNGEPLIVAHSGSTRTITDDKGNSITVDYLNNGQPLSLSANGVSIQYSYNQSGLLTSTIKAENGESTQRSYHYEDPRYPTRLTSITDERGIRYATWAYDEQGRAISSEHAGGTERTLVSYNADGSSTVTNALGKRTTYRFQTIQGVRRITAIEGEPSANCPNSNSTFTYDDRGLVKTRTDNKGNVTLFDYYERGLEVSRTEAYGTPQARTVTTQWHPTLFLPATVTEPDRVTSYSYDVQGRLTGQATTQR